MRNAKPDPEHMHTEPANRNDHFSPICSMQSKNQNNSITVLNTGTYLTLLKSPSEEHILNIYININKIKQLMITDRNTRPTESLKLPDNRSK